MAGFNKVILMGYLTRDPEGRTMPSGTAVCDFCLAVNRRWKDASGGQRDEVLFVDCTAFGKRAEAIVKYLHKGNPLHLEGHLKLERWEATDCSPRSRIRVIVERFGFMGGDKSGAATVATPKGRRSNEHASSAKQSAPGKRRMVSSAEMPTADIPF